MSIIENKKSTLSWFVLMMVGILGSLVVLASMTSAESVARQGIEQTDLPSNIIVLHDGYRDATEVSHPLTLSASKVNFKDVPDKLSTIYAYKSIYSFSAMIPGENIVVGSYLYQYSTDSLARQAAPLFINDVLRNIKHGHLVETDLPENAKDKSILHGKGMYLTDDEGSHVYWFVGVRNNTLILVLVDGMNYDSSKTGFEKVIQILQEK